MPAPTNEPRDLELEPQSQRPTLPSPQPFQRIVPPWTSPGAYRIVNDEPKESERLLASRA